MRSWLFLSVLSTFALATVRSVAAQECTDLARVISRESEKTGNSSQIQTLNKAQLCSAKYENSTTDQRAQIEASYGLFSGGASGSSAQVHQLQEQQCQGEYGSYWSNQISSNELQRVSSVGADVVRACLQSRSFRLVNLTIQNESITASFRYGGERETTINGVIVSPPDAAKCSVLRDGNADSDLSKIVGKKLGSGSTIALTCDRQPDSASSTATQKHFKGGIVGIATTSDIAQVPMIAYSIPLLPQPVADALSRDIADIRESISKLQDSNTAQAAEMGVVSGLEFYQCPQLDPTNGAGSLSGGSWGFYGCQGQISTQAFCVVWEYPKSAQHSCTKLGKLRIVK